MKQFKKLVAAILTLTLVVSGLYIVAPEAKEVKAQDASTGSADGLFAGYYVDEKCTIPSEIEGGTSKYVDEGVLSVKMQPRYNESTGTYDLRLISTVDTLNYENVGFKVSFDADGDKVFEDDDNGDNVDEIIEWDTTVVLERIKAVDENTVTYNYSPKVVDTKSEYFVTGTLRGITDATKDFLVEPFWTTLDGTKVCGQSRWFSIDDMVNTNINVAVELTEAKYNEIAVDSTVAVGSSNGTVTEKYFDGTYAHINLAVADKTALPSASIVTIGGQQVVYRNLESKAASDTTWYSEYVAVNAGETDFVIATAADLYGLANITAVNLDNKNIYLIADIDLNDVTKMDWTTGTVKSGETYTPITWGSPTDFYGTFDGQMHTIRGLYTNQPDKLSQGLFGSTYAGSYIKNLYLTDSYIKGARMIGSIIGQNRGSVVEGVYSSATVIATADTFLNQVGGIVGASWQTNTEINNCWFAGNVTALGTGKYSCVGGIAGYVEGITATINNCLNTGTVTSYSNLGAKMAGGIAGGTNTGNGVWKINGCVGAGSVVNKGVSSCWHLGSLLGYSFSSDTVVRSSYGTAESCAKQTVNIAGSDSATGQVTEADLYGAAGWSTTVLNDDCWVAVEGGIPELISFRELSSKEISDVSTVKRPSDTSWYNTTDTTFTLYTEEEFKGFIDLSRATTNFVGTTVCLGADLVLNEGDATTWETQAPINTYLPISTTGSGLKFAGTFDGKEHTISGLYLSYAVDNIGMFQCTEANSMVKNFKLTNSYIKGGNAVGSIVGRLLGDVEGVYSDAVVLGTGQAIGGIVGQTWDTEGTISNCQFAGNVTARYTGNFTYVAGILGYTRDTTTHIYNCLFSGDVTVNSAGKKMAGGIAGGTYHGNSNGILDIKQCLSVGRLHYNTSTSTTLVDMGSIVGYTINGNSTVTNSYASVECWPNATTYLTASEIKGRAGQLSEVTLTGASGWAQTALSGTYWVPVKGSTPQLKAFQTVVAADVSDVVRVDTSWHDGATTAGTVYTLEDAGDLYGLAALSKVYNFSGQTVQLSDELTAAIDMQASKGVLCEAIGDASVPFMGIFDGNGKSVQNLRIKTGTVNAGMFGVVGASGVVKNFRLTDSVIESTLAGRANIGSIAGQCIGTIQDIYTEADVVCAQNVAGGLVGLMTGSNPTISNCWYAGDVRMTSSTSKIGGGLVATALNATEARIEHCLFTGSLYSAVEYNGNYSEILGGICAEVDQNSKLYISDTLSNGSISTKRYENGQGYRTVSATFAQCYQRVTQGDGSTAALSEVIFENAVYATKDCFANLGNMTNGDWNCVQGSATEFTSEKNGTIGDLNSDYWVAVEADQPILKMFQ